MNGLLYTELAKNPEAFQTYMQYKMQGNMLVTLIICTVLLCATSGWLYWMKTRR